ncbi:MAG: anhydro-N-acetylmuramic acid kinase [Marinobacterium sp.]|nr:anhydro-N-acetylmuramic acid kinase [Marinobacterium sp.]
MKHIYIGLMSGTSLDSIDAVAVDICADHCTLLAADNYTLPMELRQQILQLSQPGNHEIDRMGQLDIELGKLFAKCCNQLIEEQSIDRAHIRAIGSHGQTIRHRPGKQQPGFTLQIGDPNTVAEHTGLTTVADFRRRDMAAGGQGAPLVPAFHQDLFRTPAHNRMLINIGGMSNITVLPARANITTTGYDTGPGNVLMDSWIKLQQGQTYDHNGQWASSGTVNQSLLDQLLSLPWLELPPPRSTGREQFNLEWLQHQLVQLSSSVMPADVQATLLEYTARTISDAIQQHDQWSQYEFYLCGGGAHNQALKQRLNTLLAPAKVETTSALGLDPDWIEAMAFAWLAWRTMEGLSGNLSTVTGASGERILGAIWPA